MKLSNVRAAAVLPALVAGCLGFAAAAQAALCPPPTTLTNQQEGVCVTDNVATRAVFQTASEAGSQEAFFSTAGVPLLDGFTQGIVFLTEPPGEPAEGGPTAFPDLLNLPGITVPSNPSDVLALRVSTVGTAPGIDIAFLSDGALPPDVRAFNTFVSGATGAMPLLATITETGRWQDLSSFFHVTSTSVMVQSDVSGISPIPEPASLALLGTALVGLGLFRRRHQTGA